MNAVIGMRGFCPPVERVRQVYTCPADRRVFRAVYVDRRRPRLLCEQASRLDWRVLSQSRDVRAQPASIRSRGTVVRVATIRRGLEFIGQHGRPLFPGEVALSGKPHGQRKGLGLPGLSKDGTALVARERGQRSEPVAIGLQFRHDRDNYPTYQCKQNRAARRPLPTTPAP